MLVYIDSLETSVLCRRPCAGVCGVAVVTFLSSITFFRLRNCNSAGTEPKQSWGCKRHHGVMCLVASCMFNCIITTKLNYSHTPWKTILLTDFFLFAISVSRRQTHNVWQIFRRGAETFRETQVCRVIPAKLACSSRIPTMIYIKGGYGVSHKSRAGGDSSYVLSLIVSPPSKVLNFPSLPSFFFWRCLLFVSRFSICLLSSFVCSLNSIVPSILKRRRKLCKFEPQTQLDLHQVFNGFSVCDRRWV